MLAPPDIEERFGVLGRNIFPGEMTPDQLLSFRPLPGYGDYRTPVKRPFLCGSGTHPGGGVMAVPGRNAARVVLRDLRKTARPWLRVRSGRHQHQSLLGHRAERADPTTVP